MRSTHPLEIVRLTCGRLTVGNVWECSSKVERLPVKQRTLERYQPLPPCAGHAIKCIAKFEMCRASIPQGRNSMLFLGKVME